MPLSRPILLALIGAVLVGGAFFATRGSSDSASEDTSGPVVPAPEPDATAPPLKQGTAKATTDAREALQGAKAVTSGTFDLHLSARGLDVTADGSFQSKGLTKMPLLRMEVTAKSGGEALEVGAVSMGERGYLIRGDEALQLQAQGWNALTQVRAENAKNGRNGDRFQGYTSKELDSMKFVGRETMDGVPVLHFRGTAEGKNARELFAGMADIFEKTSLDSPLPGRLARSIEGGTEEFWVGAEDHVIRRARARYRSSATPFEIDFSRASLGEPQKITAPADASAKTAADAGWDRDAFGLAFSALALGVFAVEPPESDSDRRVRPEREQAKPDQKPARREHSPARPERKQVRRAGTTPAQVKRAVDQHKVVILFFRQRGADDDAVATAVKSQRGRRNVAVFILPVGQAPKYEKFGGGNVVRAPSLLILGRDPQPRLFEGFIDSATLAQAVTDAR